MNAGAVSSRFDVSEPSVTLTKGGSKWVRFRRLLQRFWQRLKDTVWGKPDQR